MSYKNMKDIDWDKVNRDIRLEVKKWGFCYISDRPLTMHPSDWYLRVVLAKDIEENVFSTWIYNAITGNLSDEEYDDSRESANKRFLGK